VTIIYQQNYELMIFLIVFYYHANWKKTILIISNVVITPLLENPKDILIENNIDFR